MKPAANILATPPNKRVVVAGVGNIGSFLVAHLARMPNLAQVTIIDRDVYEDRNLSQQDIQPGDVGRAKAQVQAHRLRRLNRSLQVRALNMDLHDVPLGELRADVLLGCLDSLEGRRVMNQAAWRLGVPWIDCGVSSEGGLFVRVAVYVPGPDNACLECAWDDRQYQRLEQVHPCLAGQRPTTPTPSTASLGAFAAAMQAIECAKLLAGDTSHALVSRQVLSDVQHHTHCVTHFRCNHDCRFDHKVWRIRRLGGGVRQITFGQVLDTAAQVLGARGEKWVRVEGRPFVGKLQCTECGRSRDTLCLVPPRSASPKRCGHCGASLEPVGFEMRDRLPLRPQDDDLLTRPLVRMGFRPGDVFSIGSDSGVEVHFEIGSEKT